MDRVRRSGGYVAAATVAILSAGFVVLPNGAEAAEDVAASVAGPTTAPKVKRKASRDGVIISGQLKNEQSQRKNGQPKRKSSRGVAVEPTPLPRSITETRYVSACIWAPPDAAGRVPERVDMCSRASDTCNDPGTPAEQRRWYFYVWQRERFGPPAYQQLRDWRMAGTVCYRPEDVPRNEVEVIPERVVTWVDVYNAIRNEPAARKRVTVQPAGRTLVNADTIVYTSGEKWTKDGIALLGFSVDVEGTPTSYRWSFGDGSTLSTKSAGRPYPAKDVTHKYLKRADGLEVSVTTTYAARFRVDGGEWQTIDQPLTVAGPPTALAVREAIPVLVEPDR